MKQHFKFSVNFVSVNANIIQRKNEAMMNVDASVKN